MIIKRVETHGDQKQAIPGDETKIGNRYRYGRGDVASTFNRHRDCVL